MSKIKTVYLIHAIEFLENPEPEWVPEIKSLLKKEVDIECIAPVEVSYLVGQDIRDNQAYTAKLKHSWELTALIEFMNNIWSINLDSVTKSDAVVSVVRSPEELKILSHSGGSICEVCENRYQGKPSFLVCECDSLVEGNSHFLRMFLEKGGIFKSRAQLVEFIRQYNNSQE